MAGWGDDPVLADLRDHVYEQGWTPIKVRTTRESDTVTVEKDGEKKDFTSDHIAFHRFVEGLQEDYGL